jgi:hypothetical protein
MINFDVIFPKRKPMLKIPISPEVREGSELLKHEPKPKILKYLFCGKLEGDALSIIAQLLKTAREHEQILDYEKRKTLMFMNECKRLCKRIDLWHRTSDYYKKHNPPPDVRYQLPVYESLEV